MQFLAGIESTGKEHAGQMSFSISANRDIGQRGWTKQQQNICKMNIVFNVLQLVRLQVKSADLEPRSWKKSLTLCSVNLALVLFHSS